MGVHSAIVAAVKTIIESDNDNYLRAQDQAEANTVLPSIVIGETIGIHINLPDYPIAAATPQAPNFIGAYNLEVMFLQKINPDATGAQIDTALDVTEAKALEFIDQLQVSAVVDPSRTIEVVQFSAVDTRHIFDTIMAGWGVTVEVPTGVKFCT